MTRLIAMLVVALLLSLLATAPASAQGPFRTEKEAEAV